MGGWQADLDSVGVSWFGLPAAGVILNSTGGIATLTNDGSIGALSDRAVARQQQHQHHQQRHDDGLCQLTAATAATATTAPSTCATSPTPTGDGVRDTVRVAVADLGGPAARFTNNGTLALLGAPGATTLDSTGQYLPLGNALNAMALGGPVQGQLVRRVHVSRTPASSICRKTPSRATSC